MQRHHMNRGTLLVGELPLWSYMQSPQYFVYGGGFAYKWSKYPSKDLGHPICDWTLAIDNGPEEVPVLWIFGNPYNLGGM